MSEWGRLRSSGKAAVTERPALRSLGEMLQAYVTAVGALLLSVRVMGGRVVWKVNVETGLDDGGAWIGFSLLVDPLWLELLDVEEPVLENALYLTALRAMSESRLIRVLDASGVGVTIRHADGEVEIEIMLRMELVESDVLGTLVMADGGSPPDASRPGGKR